MRKINLFIIIYVFLYIYSPPILPINILHFLSAIAWVVILVKHKKISNIISKSKIKLPFILLFITMLYILLLSILTFGNIINVYYILVIMIELIPCSVFIAFYCMEKGYTVLDLLKLILIVGSIQGFIALIAFLNPNIQKSILNIIVSNGFSEILYLLGSHRAYGISSNLTYTTPMFQSFMVIISIYLAITKNIRYIIFVPLLLFSGLINARNSIVTVLIGIIIIFVYLLLLRTNKKFSRVMIIVIVASIVLNITLKIIQQTSQVTYMWLNDGYKEILSFITGEDIGYFSYVENNKPLLYLKGLEYVFGKGYYILGNMRGIGSDIGFYNDIWFGGVIYCSLMYSTFIIILYNLYRIKTNEDIMIGKFIATFITVVLILANIKGIVFQSNELIGITLLISIFLIARYPKNI